MATTAAGEWWEASKAAIAASTGLSPEAFFTVVAVIAALYMAVSDSFARPAPSPPRRREMEGERTLEPLPPPVKIGEVTEKELRVYDGSDPKKPLLMAIKGQIYDVTQSRMFYGPGGPYALFAGRDASRALAKMSFEPSDITGDVSGLGPLEVEALQEWEQKFMGKYVKVGTIKKTVPVSEEYGRAHAEITGRGFDTNAIHSNPERVQEENRAATRSHGGAMGQPMEKSGLARVGDSKSIQEDEVERSEEIPDVDVNGSKNHEGAGETREAPGVDENNINIHQDGVQGLNETSDIEVKNA